MKPFHYTALRTATLTVAAALLAGAWSTIRSEVTGPNDMLLSDNIRQERETLRPPRPDRPKVLVFALDGVGRSTMVDLLKRGEAPHLAAALGDGSDPLASAFAPEDVLSVLPSITMAAWTTTYTGAWPGESGVPGNEWYDREQMRFFAPAPMSADSKGDTMEMVTDGLLGEAVDVPTLFEQADRRSHASLVPLYRGVDIYALPGAAAVLNSAVAGGATGEVDHELYSEIDQEGAEAAVDAIDRYGVPDLNVVYFPGIDLYTHVAPDPVIAQRDYFREIVDPAIEEVLEEYRDAGVLASTWIVVVSDHGHTVVAQDDVHALEASGEDEPPEVLKKAGFRVRDPSIETDTSSDEQTHQAVLAYQGAMAYVYLADRSGCLEEQSFCDWKRPPRHEEDVLAAARAFWEASDTGAHVKAMKGTLDMVIARMPAGSEGSSPEAPVGLGVFDGEDLVPLGDYLKENPRPELLALEERLNGLVQGGMSHRVGDLILLARFDDAGVMEDRYYFSDPYTSNHGSAYASDSEITFIVGRPGRPADEVRAAVVEAVGVRPSQRDVTPLILRLLDEK